MKFLIDANLPFKLKVKLDKLGYDVIHTDNLPNKEFTNDEEIREFSRIHNRTIITKDTDFLQSHLLRNKPSYLLLITTGNISNKDLILLIESNFEKIVGLFDKYKLIELSTQGIVLYEH